MHTSKTPYDHCRALVLGCGQSGLAAAELLHARGAQVAVVDAAPAERLAASAAKLTALGIDLRAGGGALPEGAWDLCVVSPGIPATHPWVAGCRARGRAVIGELELGFAYWPARVLAVTGSKGKSSLVKLCADTLNRAGVRAAPAGNYGTPLSRLSLEASDLAWAVVEVSSFQLEHVATFRPNVAVLLNLQADHLDRHASMAEYRDLKLRLFARQKDGDTALLPEHLPVSGEIGRAVRLWRFGAGPSCAWRYGEHTVIGRDARPECRVPMAGSWFDNPVLGLAAAAGAGALTACGLEADAIGAGLRSFTPLPHRVQCIAEIAGVRYVDDSKATSLAAVAAALEMVPGPVRLIAGGRLKEHDLDGLKLLLTRRVTKVYVIGECAQRMLHAWSDAVPGENSGTLDAAVAAASREACAGETILLSPGCASFDQFGSYRERGEAFARLVRARSSIDQKEMAE